MTSRIVDRRSKHSSCNKLAVAGLATALLASSVPRAAYADPPFELAPPPATPKRRSTGMMVAGIVLTSLGSAMLLTGAVTTGIGSSGGGDGGTILVAVVGLPFMVGSTVFAGIGIPLWVVGAQPAPAGSASAQPLPARVAASISFGAGSGAVRVSF